MISLAISALQVRYIRNTGSSTLRDPDFLWTDSVVMGALVILSCHWASPRFCT